MITDRPSHGERSSLHIVSQIPPRVISVFLFHFFLFTPTLPVNVSLNVTTISTLFTELQMLVTFASTYVICPDALHRTKDAGQLNTVD